VQERVVHRVDGLEDRRIRLEIALGTAARAVLDQDPARPVARCGGLAASPRVGADP
jgi:hypothetical protein